MNNEENTNTTGYEYGDFPPGQSGPPGKHSHKEIITVDGRSPFGMNRKYRRALFSSVRQGTANEQEIARFKSLGKDAYPWLQSSTLIERMIRESLPVSKHTKKHKRDRITEALMGPKTLTQVEEV